MFIAALIGCIFTFVVVNVVERRLGISAATGTAFIFFSLSFMMSCGMVFFSPTIIINSILLIIVGFVTGRRNSGDKTFLRWSFGAMVVAMLMSSGLAAYDVVTTANPLKQKYAFESIEDRLSYAEQAAQTNSVVVSNPRTEKHLFELEGRMQSYRGRFRSRALGQVHESTVTRFINSRGFGSTRMGQLGESWINRVEEKEPISISPFSNSEFDDTPYVANDKIELPSEDDLWEQHKTNYESFVFADGFGYVKSRTEVAGFLSHGFGKSSRTLGEPVGIGSNWRISQLELVSLLKFDTDRVYVSDSLPRMDDLKDAKTRSLSNFEQQALRKLRDGEDLVVQAKTQRTRMLGSLRAVTQCLDCHNVKRGQLLGAFSYEFRRTRNKQATEPIDGSAI